MDLAATPVTVTAGERQQICVNKVRHAFDFITTTVLFMHYLFVLLLLKVYFWYICAKMNRIAGQSFPHVLQLRLSWFKLLKNFRKHLDTVWKNGIAIFSLGLILNIGVSLGLVIIFKLQHQPKTYFLNLSSFLSKFLKLSYLFSAVTLTNCSSACGTARCYGPRREECCNSQCAAGCTGPRNTDCFVSSGPTVASFLQ